MTIIDRLQKATGETAPSRKTPTIRDLHNEWERRELRKAVHAATLSATAAFKETLFAALQEKDTTHADK